MKYKQIALSAFVLISLMGISFLSVGGCGGGKKGCSIERHVVGSGTCESLEDEFQCSNSNFKVGLECFFGCFTPSGTCKLSGCQLGCPGSEVAEPEPTQDPISDPVTFVSAPVLLTPADNEIIQQNNPDIGCPFDPASGFGSTIFFDWTESTSPNGISGYHLAVQNINAELPLIFIFLQDSFFTFLECNSFASDEFLDGWNWTVQAEDNLGNLSEISSGKFVFEPCRLDDVTPCNSF